MTPGHRPTARRVLAALLVPALLLAACSSGHRDDPRTGTSGGTTTTAAAAGHRPPAKPRPNAPQVHDQLRIEVLSSQPDRVTGGDARILVVPPPGVPASSIEVAIDGRDVTSQLQPTPAGLAGVVSGFVEGTSLLTATAGADRVVQRVRDWPLQGPMISGPHLPLLACSTQELGLGAPTDADCSAPTRITYEYVSTTGVIKPLADPTQRPTDLATGTIDGKRVRLIVRREEGVINRSVYWIASIDPSGGADVGGHPATPAWNGRLVYRFGGGCGTTYGQGTPLTTVDDPTLLSAGYGVATATFNTFNVQCNDVLSAETAMMVKERFVELFGLPVHTIGEGASGGSIQLHLIAQDYPGLIDGAAAILPFPDAVTVAAGVTDCGLLDHYYRSPQGRALTDAQRAAVDGHLTTGTCPYWERTFLGGVDPTDGCDPKIPASDIFSTTNPTGIRCTLQDANVNQFGRDPETGFANRPLDNVGVQYGLDALDARQITAAQFLSLNAHVGGYDINGGFQATREAANPTVIAQTYQRGRIAEGGGDLAQIPIIDLNIYTDPAGDIHDRFRAFSLRDRLIGGPKADPEAAPGFQIWTRGSGRTTLAQAVGNITSGGGYGPGLVEVIDRWLTAMDADHRAGTRIEKLRRDRPAEAVDNCIDPATGRRLSGVGIYDRPGPCRDDFPVKGDPRTAAGAPQADDIIKCQLKPIDPADYKVPFTAAQLQTLHRIFPTGVCDWKQQGVGQGRPTLPNRAYGSGDDPQARS